MIRQHQLLNGHEFERTPGDGRGQEGLACCGPRDCRIRQDLATEQQMHYLIQSSPQPYSVDIISGPISQMRNQRLSIKSVESPRLPPKYI